MPESGCPQLQEILPETYSCVPLAVQAASEQETLSVPKQRLEPFLFGETQVLGSGHPQLYGILQKPYSCVLWAMQVVSEQETLSVPKQDQSLSCLGGQFA